MTSSSSSSFGEARVAARVRRDLADAAGRWAGRAGPDPVPRNPDLSNSRRPWPASRSSRRRSPPSPSFDWTPPSTGSTSCSIEHPGTDDAVGARLRMARLLAVTGSVPQALLQCQLLRDEVPGDHPARGEAIELASLLARRFRAGQSPAFAVLPGLRGDRGEGDAVARRTVGCRRRKRGPGRAAR